MKTKPSSLKQTKKADREEKKNQEHKQKNSTMRTVNKDYINKKKKKRKIKNSRK